jgi:hypothetical protein
MPVDRGAIDEQLREIGEGDRWWEQREFRALPHILHADERIRGLVVGKLLGPRRPRLRPAGRWLLVATNLRLICLKQERFARKQIEIASGEVRRVTSGSRLGGHQITIETARWKYRVRIARVDAFRFGGALDGLFPNLLAARLDAEESRPWLAGVPGVGRLIQKGATSTAGDFAPRAQVERVESAVERLQADVERLQHQVAFLEDLLQKRAEDSFVQR